MKIKLALIIVALLLVSCAAIQSFLHVASGGLIGPPLPPNAAAADAAWNAWMTWVGSLFGFTDPQAQTMATAVVYSRADTLAKAAVKTIKHTARVTKAAVVEARKPAKKAAQNTGLPIA